MMDCDMRKPSVHRTFGYKKVAGLSEYLTSDIPLSEVLLKTAAPKLTLLPAGSPPPNPAELLSSKKMKALIEEVKNRYDDRYVIIDSPPSRVAAETNAILQRVDSVVLVVGYGETPKESVAELVEIIGREKISAVVVNQCNSAVNYWGIQKHYYGYSK
jgi:capsular exopolysaccharide synthesis family protein